MHIARAARPIHFEDLGGAEFERLVFAYHLRAGWTDLAWYGQTGSDQGRDIIGIEIFDDRPNQRTVIQCVNRDRLTQVKAEKDMAAAVIAHHQANRTLSSSCAAAAFQRSVGTPSKKLQRSSVTIT